MKIHLFVSPGESRLEVRGDGPFIGQLIGLLERAQPPTAAPDFSSLDSQPIPREGVVQGLSISVIAFDTGPEPEPVVPSRPAASKPRPKRRKDSPIAVPSAPRKAAGGSRPFDKAMKCSACDRRIVNATGWSQHKKAHAKNGLHTAHLVEADRPQGVPEEV